MMIRTKIVLSLATAAVSIIASFLIFLAIKSNRDHLLRQSYLNGMERSVKTAMQIHESSMINLINDYTHWDEMAVFTQTQDTEWSRINLSTILDVHALNGIWVYNKKRSLIYSSLDLPPGTNPSLFFSDPFFRFLEGHGSIHFFHRDNETLFEFTAAPVFTTNETLGSGVSHGYMMVCRTLDADALKSLTEISASSVRVITDAFISEVNDESQIQTTIPLYTWNHVPAGYLEFTQDQPLLKSFRAITNATSLFYFAFALILLVLMAIVLYYWLDIPSKKIIDSLVKEDTEPIKSLANHHNEFGQIAVMIESFFRQKNELAGIIQEKNEVLDSLADAESKNRAILSAIPDHLFRINLFGVISDCQIRNPGDFSRESSDLIGKNFEEILPAGMEGHLHQVISEVDRTKQPQFFNFSIPGWQDQAKYFEARITITTQGDYLVVVRNITTRKKAEIALYSLLEKEGDLNRMKTHFLSTISHEFRTPLSAILSNIQMLELYDEKWTAEKKIPAFNRIQQAVNQMNNLLNDLTLLSKDEAGKIKINPTRFDINTFLNDLVKQTSNLMNHSNGIALEIALKETMVTMDKDLLRYIFTNLLSNAIKYSGKNPVIYITVNEDAEHSLVFRFRDNGVGIPAKDLPVIFEPFNRGENVSDIPGTGLGLSIVKRCIELHKGSINIESDLGKGTLITVVLPCFLNKSISE